MEYRVRELPEREKVEGARGRGGGRIGYLFWTLSFSGIRRGLFKIWGPISLALRRVLMESVDVEVQNEYTGLVIIYSTCPTISIFRGLLTYVKSTVQRCNCG